MGQQGARQTFFGVGGKGGGSVTDCLKVSWLVRRDDVDAPILSLEDVVERDVR